MASNFTVYPPGYLNANTQQSKQLNCVILIDGVPDVFSIVPVYEKLRYGDPRLRYGLPGLVYGGLIAKDGVRPYIMVDDGITIGQQVEPEQGRASVATMSFSFIDKDGYMSKLISPGGGILPELLGGPLWTVWVGYGNTSFPDDYFVTFRGSASQTTSAPGKITIQLSDANLKRRAQIFTGSLTTLSVGLPLGTETTVVVGSTTGLYDYTPGPDGSYDPAVTNYVQIDDEWVSYGPGAIQSDGVTITPVVRGQRGTGSPPHDVGATITSGIQLLDNPIDMALKLMLSGWGGPWTTGVTCVALGTVLEALNPQPRAILFNVDVDVYYGLTLGDYITVSGSIAGNDGTYIIQDIQDLDGDSNRVVLVNTPLNIESPATTVGLAFRSQYDTYPAATVGVQGTPREIDVDTHQYIKRLFFTTANANLKFFKQSQSSTDSAAGEDCKTFIESQINLPFGLYSITRYGRISMAATTPPIADDKLLFIDQTNVCDPQNITVTRSLNNRRFYNVITYDFDLDDNGDYLSEIDQIDSNSLNLTGVTSTLPITADGVHTDTGVLPIVQSRIKFLLNRFKNAAYEITVTVNWEIGSLIEVGDAVVLTDNGALQITNFDNGDRNLGQQLFAVIQRQVNVSEGNVKITLLSNIGYKIGQRYATISPSSLVTTGSSTTSIRIQDSFGILYPNNEQKKWSHIAGNQIRVHSYDYSVDGITTLLGFSPTDPYLMLISPALAFTPAAGQIVDVAKYDTSSAQINSLSKTLYVYLDQFLTVTSGTSGTVFDVSSGDAAKAHVGYPILVHSPDWTTSSIETVLLSVSGTTLTVQDDLGFTPTSGMLVELNGFDSPDAGGSYRFL